MRKIMVTLAVLLGFGALAPAFASAAQAATANISNDSTYSASAGAGGR
jgi:hypothetical protein